MASIELLKSLKIDIAEFEITVSKCKRVNLACYTEIQLMSKIEVDFTQNIWYKL